MNDEEKKYAEGVGAAVELLLVIASAFPPAIVTYEAKWSIVVALGKAFGKKADVVSEDVDRAIDAMMAEIRAKGGSR